MLSRYIPAIGAKMITSSFVSNISIAICHTSNFLSSFLTFFSHFFWSSSSQIQKNFTIDGFFKKILPFYYSLI
jgi:hypothetical protein